MYDIAHGGKVAPWHLGCLGWPWPRPVPSSTLPAHAPSYLAEKLFAPQSHTGGRDYYVTDGEGARSESARVCRHEQTKHISHDTGL